MLFLQRFFINSFLSLGLVVQATTAFADPTLELSLKDAIFLALRYNPAVQSSEIQRVVDKMSLQLAHWEFDPQFSLTANVTHTIAINQGIKSESETSNITPGVQLLTPYGTRLNVSLANPVSYTVGGSRYYNPALSATITQPLLQGAGKDIVLASLHKAQNQERLNKLSFKNTIMQSITTTISQYAAVASAQNSLKAQEVSLKDSIKTLKQQQAMLKAGRIAPADLVQYQASVASQQLSLQQQAVNLQQQIRSLLITLGIDPNIHFTVSNEVRFADSSLPPLAECIRLGLEDNITYQQALINYENAKISLNIATDQQRWQLNLAATRIQGGGSGGAPNAGLPSLTNGANSNTSVSLNLTVPIDNMPLKQQLVQAKINLQQQRIQLDAQRRQVINDVTNAYNTVINQQGQIKVAKDAMTYARKNLDIAQEKLKYGKVSAFEASTLQTSLINQQIAYINAETAYVTNLAQLDQTIGNALDRWQLKVKY